MRTATDILNAIEVRAEHAIVQELHIMRKEVLQLRPSLSVDDQEHANALLTKLGRLASEQMVITPDNVVPEQQPQRVPQTA